MPKRVEDAVRPFLGEVFPGRYEPRAIPSRGTVPSPSQSLAYAMNLQQALGGPAFMTLESARLGNPTAQDVLAQFINPEYMTQDALAAIQRYGEGRQKAGNIGAIPAAVAGVGYDLLKYLDPEGRLGRTLGIGDIQFTPQSSRPSMAALTNYLAGIGSTLFE